MSKQSTQHVEKRQGAQLNFEHLHYYLIPEALIDRFFDSELYKNFIESIESEGLPFQPINLHRNLTECLKMIFLYQQDNQYKEKGVNKQVYDDYKSIHSAILKITRISQQKHFIDFIKRYEISDDSKTDSVLNTIRFLKSESYEKTSFNKEILNSKKEIEKILTLYEDSHPGNLIIKNATSSPYKEIYIISFIIFNTLFYQWNTLYKEKRELNSVSFLLTKLFYDFLLNVKILGDRNAIKKFKPSYFNKLYPVDKTISKG